MTAPADLGSPKCVLTSAFSQTAPLGRRRPPARAPPAPPAGRTRGSPRGGVRIRVRVRVRAPTSTRSAGAASRQYTWEPALRTLLLLLPLPPYSEEKVANREIRVWHFVIENGY
jgi:hypothetical protein